MRLRVVTIALSVALGAVGAACSALRSADHPGGARSLGTGWRLPTDDEWRRLAKHYGGVHGDSSDAGKGAYNALLIGGRSGFGCFARWRLAASSFERRPIEMTHMSVAGKVALITSRSRRTSRSR